MAAAPRAEGDDPATATVAPVKMPVYAIHSRADRTVPLDRVERGVKALQAQGGNVTLDAHRRHSPQHDPGVHRTAGGGDTVGQQVWAR